MGRGLGFEVKSRITEYPKVYWRTLSQAGTPLRIKVEVNTHERSPALPLANVPFRVESPWWTGQAQVRTFQLAELIATKLRALYQRSKGRDLFDVWLALTVGHSVSRVSSRTGTARWGTRRRARRRSRPRRA